MKKGIIAAILMFAFVFAKSQNLNIENVASVKLKDMGVIEDNNEVKGYYYFYKADKADKKNINYKIRITDENLRDVNSVDIAKPKAYTLIEAEYNGEAFGFLFYNPKENNCELISFDKNLKQTGTVIKKIVGGNTDRIFKMVAAGYDGGHQFLVSIPNKGFMYYGFAESKRINYSVDCYDNNMKLLWNSTGPETKDIVTADDAFQSETHIGSLITRRESAFSKDADYDLLVNDVLTGKETFKMELADKEYNISAAKISHDKQTNSIMVFGEYYNIKEKENKAASLGYFYLMLDITGKVVQRKIISWEKDMAKFIPVDKRGKMEKGVRAFVHEIVRTNDGDFFVVGEQYKKAASGWGIASAALSGGRGNTATVQLEVLDMVILRFDSKLELKSLNIFEKDPHFYLLPAGSEWAGAKQLAYYGKTYGWFDYSYTQLFTDKNTFMVTYINYDKDKGEKGRNVLGAIVYTPEKTFTIDRTDLNRKSTDYRVGRAKSGYIWVSEYFKKEKTVKTRLEKIKY